MADGPLTNLANLKGRTDANGYLIVTIGGGTISPTLILNGNGLVGAPSYSFTSDPTTGFYRVGASNVGLALGGNLLFNFTTSGLDVSGKFTKYNNITTTGQGVPSIYGSGAVAATTGTIASLATYTVGATAAEFEIAGHVDVNTVTTAAFTMVANYTDPAGRTQAQTLSFMLVAGGALVTVVTAASGTVPYNGVPMRIRCKATTAITILTTGTVTTVNYDANASIIQIN